MKSQYQNLQDLRSRNNTTCEVTLNTKPAVPLTEEVLNQDNRICYKKIREELNRRVKSIVNKKEKQQAQKIKTKN